MYLNNFFYSSLFSPSIFHMVDNHIFMWNNFQMCLSFISMWWFYLLQNVLLWINASFSWLDCCCCLGHSQFVHFCAEGFLLWLLNIAYSQQLSLSSSIFGFYMLGSCLWAAEKAISLCVPLRCLMGKWWWSLLTRRMVMFLDVPGCFIFCISKTEWNRCMVYVKKFN